MCYEKDNTDRMRFSPLDIMCSRAHLGGAIVEQPGHVLEVRVAQKGDGVFAHPAAQCADARDANLCESKC